MTYYPQKNKEYEPAYQIWKADLEKNINKQVKTS